MENKEKKKPRAILVGICLKYESKYSLDFDIFEFMEELSELAEASEIEVVGNMIQNKDSYEPKYLIGKGKVEEIKDMCQKLDANLVIFSHELNGSQLRNLEEYLDVEVIDRTNLILDIFSKRAISKSGKLQVELAQQNYRSSRLTGFGVQMSRQDGHIGSRGPGEKKLETDRRHIQARIDDIKKELNDIEKNRQTQRKQRLKTDIPIVALVGYTNAGKSTLFNQMIKTHPDYKQEKEVFVKDMLFASLDINLRRANLNSINMDYLVTDTVGFVSSIPHYLMDAFKATLEELEYADIILNVVDFSSKRKIMQLETTEKILNELNLENKSIIYVFNKIDKIDDESIDNILISKYKPSCQISAVNGYNLTILYELIEEFLTKDLIDVQILIPYDKGNILDFLHQKYNFTEEFLEEGSMIKLKINKSDMDRIKDYMV